MCCTPCSLHHSPHVPEVNWVPLSVVMRAGTPKRATHVVMKASSTVSTSILLKGTASGHRVDLSIMVSR